MSTATSIDLQSASLSGDEVECPLGTAGRPREAIRAFVQCRAGHVASETLASALIEHVRRELGPIATPAAIEFVPALPKTRSGKILCRYLKAKEGALTLATSPRWNSKQ